MNFSPNLFKSILVAFCILLIGCNSMPPDAQAKNDELNKRYRELMKDYKDAESHGLSIYECNELIPRFEQQLIDYKSFNSWRKEKYGIEKDNSRFLGGIENLIVGMYKQIGDERASIREGNERYKEQKFTCKVCGREIGRAGKDLAGGLCLQCNNYKREDAMRGIEWEN